MEQPGTIALPSQTNGEGKSKEVTPPTAASDSTGNEQKGVQPTAPPIPNVNEQGLQLTPLSFSPPQFPPWLLNTGFLVALVLAAACLAAAGYYLYQFQTSTQNSMQTAITQAIKGKAVSDSGVSMFSNLVLMYLTRLQLQSCGIVIGLAFGFLGFALFLLGIQSPMSAAGNTATLSLRLVSISPGVFVLLCSTILIGICITQSMPVELGQAPSPGVVMPSKIPPPPNGTP